MAILPIFVSSILNSEAGQTFNSECLSSNVRSDVLTDEDELTVQIYDRGNQLPNGDDLFLGMARWKPTFGRNSMDVWLKLQSRHPDDGSSISGEVRLQASYINLETVS
jgi:hypothetical protein